MGTPLEFDESTLRRIYESPPVGPDWPYCGGSEQEIEAFLMHLAYEVKRCPLVGVDARCDHYGSGYASYIELFCYKKNDESTTRGLGWEAVTGILYYISRLCPVVCFGPEKRVNGGGGFLTVDTVDRLPPGGWSREHDEVTSVLRRNGYVFPERSALDELLPFPAKIPTILSTPPYRIFDLIFHWED